MLGLSSQNLAHLCNMLMTTSFSIFAQGLSYGLSKLKKTGKIIVKL